MGKILKNQLLLVDNYDSFTFNVVDMLHRLGKRVFVLKNDEPNLLNQNLNQFEGIIISPGPKRPADAGMLLSFLTKVPIDKPLLGLCLGHQALGEFHGLKLIRALKPMHGITSGIIHQNHPLFMEVPSGAEFMRYHSLILNVTDRSKVEVLATTTQNEIMAIHVKESVHFGLQFHPESILSPFGPQVVKNWLGLCGFD